MPKPADETPATPMPQAVSASPPAATSGRTPAALTLELLKPKDPLPAAAAEQLMPTNDDPLAAGPSPDTRPTTMTNVNPPLPPGPPPTTRPPTGQMKIPTWQRREEEMTSHKRSASAGPSYRIRGLEGGREAKAGSAKPPPPPDRDVPYFVQEAHEVQVGNEWDIDWTLKADWTEELRLREKRNQLIKQQLQAGRTVAYRQSGWSLNPRVKSNDLCYYSPVKSDEEVNEDDIVFCEVQPKNRFYAHLVKDKVKSGSGAFKYWISNIHGYYNGWCRIEHIHGKLYQVET